MEKKIRSRWTERQIARSSIEIEQLFKTVRRHSRNDANAWAVVQHMLIRELVERMESRPRIYLCEGDGADSRDHPL